MTVRGSKQLFNIKYLSDRFWLFVDIHDSWAQYAYITPLSKHIDLNMITTTNRFSVPVHCPRALYATGVETEPAIDLPESSQRVGVDQVDPVLAKTALRISPPWRVA